MKSISRPPVSNEPTPDWLRRFTKLVAFSTLFLIFAGAMVTSTGSGLAVPDWPLSYGKLFPLMRHLGAGLAIPDFPLSFGRLVPAFTSAAVAVNFAHRVGGALVAVAIVAMFLRLLRFAPTHPLRQIGTFLLLVVATQVMLGA